MKENTEYRTVHRAHAELNQEKFAFEKKYVL